METCTNRRILVEVACLDHYAPPPPPPDAPPPAAMGDADEALVVPPSRQAPTVPEGVDPLSLLPPALAAARRRNLEQLHLLKAEMAPAAFRWEVGVCREAGGGGRERRRRCFSGNLAHTPSPSPASALSSDTLGRAATVRHFTTTRRPGHVAPS